MTHGIAVPLCFTPSVGMALCASERKHIHQSVRMIVQTRMGERPLEREYGCRIHELLFKPVTPALMATAVFYVRRALLRWETRIELREVSVQRDTAIDSSRRTAASGFVVKVRYQVKADSATEEQLSFSVGEGQIVQAAGLTG